MVHHVNPFADIGSPGGVAKDVYKHWKDKGARLATDRKRCETWAWIFFIAALAAFNFGLTKDYAPLGLLFGGMLVYRAIMCRFEESTIEGMLNKWDLDCVIASLIEQRKEASENRMHEILRPATDAELARRGEIIRGMENVLKRTD
jgi:hypothetical protein